VKRLVADQAYVGFVDQAGGVERLTGRLVRQSGGGQAPQLIVEHRHELAGGLGLALVNRVQQVRNVIHK